MLLSNQAQRFRIVTSKVSVGAHFVSLGVNSEHTSHDAEMVLLCMIGVPSILAWLQTSKARGAFQSRVYDWL